MPHLRVPRVREGYCTEAPHDLDKAIHQFGVTNEAYEFIERLWDWSDPSEYLFDREYCFDPLMPKFPLMVDLGSRLASFLPWPYDQPSPSELAKAGFFFINFKDTLACYSCGVMLWHWKTNDNPWIEHRKGTNYCDHLMIHKGFDFIREGVNDRKKQEYDLTDFSFFIRVLSEPEILEELSRETELMKKFRNQDGNNRLSCIICDVADRSMTFLPCGHLLACSDCAVKLLSQTRKCPLCRVPLDNKIPGFKVYLS